MSTIFIEFPGGKRVDARVGDFTVRTDQSREHGGDASAPEPFDLFLASLGTCAGIYVLAFCQARNIATDEIRMTQRNEVLDKRLVRVVLEIELPASFPLRYVDAIRAAAMGCRVKKTLLDPPSIAIEVIHLAQSAPAIATGEERR